MRMTVVNTYDEKLAKERARYAETARVTGTCITCGQQSLDVNSRRPRCPTCVADNIVKLKFVGIDGEGMTGGCLECECEEYQETSQANLCQCGHDEFSMPKETGTGHVHKYVLLTAGDAEPVQNYNGLGWEECLEYLYAQYDAKTVFVGFFLSYDFNQIFKSLPESKAVQLFTKTGQNKRKYKNKSGIPRYHPVKVVGDRQVWEMHLHADRRLQIRPKICDCPGDTHLSAIQRDNKPCPALPWMYICDAGGFFQTSFLNVIDRSKWQTPVVTEEEYRIIEQGKSKRSSAKLDDDMRRYNALENIVLARVMGALADGLKTAHAMLTKRNWYGPGQAAQAWLRHVEAPKRGEIIAAARPAFVNAARQSYFGGWFEIMIHGIIPGITYEYDINSAYPSVIAKLPCLLHGTYKSSKPRTPRAGLPPLNDGAIRLVKASVWGSDAYIGAMPHRALDNSILRPTSSRGWYWQAELEAAIRAGVIERVECYEWETYEPCDCLPPLRGMTGLYETRLEVNKNSAQGKAYKLIYNSAYGKFAQSIGDPPYANPIYASLITSGCRTKILDAIATHPGKTSAVAMVATDAVYFLSPHPSLPISDKLGEWDAKEKHNLALFKPGVYWDDKARDAIAQGKSPVFKARGVNARDFATVIGELDAEFEAWAGTLPVEKKGWPARKFRLGFSMITCKQALQRGDWSLAGKVSEVHVTHSSYPGDKRAFVNYGGQLHAITGSREVAEFDGRVYRSKPHELKPSRVDGLPQFSKPYDKAFGATAMYESGTLDAEDYGITPDGVVKDHWYEAMQIK